MGKLTDAEVYAMRTFDKHRLGTVAVETIDIDSGRSVIASGFVELTGSPLGGLYLKITDAGRAALTSEQDK